MSTDQQQVLFEKINDHVALVTLNRVAKRNAVNGAVTRGLAAAVERVEADPQLRVAILAASGDVFCAGADLAEMAAGRVDELSTPDGGFAGFVRAPRRKPWIAAVAGKAFGGGFELVLACDLCVAGGAAEFGLPEVKRGLMASAGGAFRIARALPRALAIELAIRGQTLSAGRALDLGLINAVAEGDVVEAAQQLADDIAQNAPLAVQHTLQLARLSADLQEETLWALTAEGLEQLLQSADAREGMAAFAEKRPPRWTGQ
ncbi:MAG: enoyl-CoA hydratase-related protein [Porticoccaceae bacterium]